MKQFPMATKSIMNVIDEQQWLEDAGKAIQPVILNAFKAGGETGNKIKNFLHGKWLGHALHPIVTDVPIGAWTTAAVLDTMELCGSEKYKEGADAAVTIGLAGAAGAALTGITDWTGTTHVERKAGLAHALINISATALFLSSALLRKNESSRRTAITLSMLGYGLASFSAYIGGNLVYNQQMGVNHAASTNGFPDEFTEVCSEDELPDNSMKCVRAGETKILLARENNQLFAIAHTCSHMGGPLSEGELLPGSQVRCPWHGSVFSLKDGSVVNGPATEPQPEFEVRTRNGKIEVKLKENKSRSYVPTAG
ncbi:MAG: Rieske 2Fe-2S domain-containing protein [Ginsengibacter sp.]